MYKSAVKLVVEPNFNEKGGVRMFQKIVESIAAADQDLSAVGTAHSSAVTNLDSFDHIVESIAAADQDLSAVGTAHSSSVTNLDSFELLKETIE